MNESTPVNTNLNKVLRAVDGDLQINNPIQFSIVNDNVYSSYFRIAKNDSQTAFLQVAQLYSISANNPVTYIVLTVAANETSSTLQDPAVSLSLTKFYILINDVNDHVPTFNATQYNATVPENSIIGFPLNIQPQMFVEDLDLGANGEFTLTVEQNSLVTSNFYTSPNIVYSMSTVSILVNNSTLLDFEVNPIIQFQVTARSKLPSNQNILENRTVTVNLYLIDMNDNPPIFNATFYQVNIYENSPNETFVTQMIATDADSTGVNKAIVYSLTGKNANLFSIGNLSGTVTVAVDAANNLTLLDRETVLSSGVSVTVVAMNTIPGVASAICELNIQLLDVNDNKPIFLQSIYQGRLRENDLTFLTPLVVNATDKDVGVNADIRYSLDPNSIWTANFTINSTTGEILPIQPGLDYEKLNVTLNGIIQFLVYATDQGQPPLSGTTTVIVTVENVNDNPPVFNSSQYSTTIVQAIQPNTNVLQVFATDADLPGFVNTGMFFLLTNATNFPFRLSPSDGIFYSTSQSLSVGYYNVTVIGTDFGPNSLSTTVNVSIKVNESNINPPVFSQSIYLFNISDGTYNGNVVTSAILATDNDTSANLKYTALSSGVKAYTLSGSEVPSTNSYSNYFSFFSNQSLIVNGYLNRENVSVIQVPIQVEDLAAVKIPQTATALVIFFVQNQVINNLVFINTINDSYFIDINENIIPKDLTIGVKTTLTVIARDLADASAPITYSLDDKSNTFRIDSTQGQVYVMKMLDYEAQNSYNLTVNATNGKFNASKSIIVTVINSDDNMPRFTTVPDNGTLSISENTGNWTILFTFNATDIDNNLPGSITFAINYNTNSLFYINATSGELRLNGSLDRESPGGDQYFIQIIARNPSKTIFNFTNVLILVTDENDNSPIFPQSSYAFNLSSIAGPNEYVATLFAYDADQGNNANVTYTLLDSGNSTVSDRFQVTTLYETKANFAIIRTKVALANSGGVYYGILNAQDQGVIPRSTNCTLNFTVIAYNFYSPVFNDSITTFNITENATLGTPLHTFKATDQDAGVNGFIKYSLSSTNGDDQQFSIDSTNGNLTLKASLNASVQDLFTFNVVATDQAINIGERKSTELTLTINVIDINDNQPKFTSSSAQEQTLSIKEGSTLGTVIPGSNNIIGTLIGSVAKATDIDVDPLNKKMCYFMLSNLNRYFYLTLDGNLYALSVFDKETQQNQFEIVIKVVPGDQCNSTDYLWPPNYVSPQLSARQLLFLQPNSPVSFNPNDKTLARVNVTIADVNDNPPKFTKSALFIGVDLSTKPVTQIYDFSKDVEDPDTSNVFSFQIDGGMSISSPLNTQLNGLAASDIFTLNSTNGKMFTGNKIYFQSSMDGYFKFILNVSDGVFFTEINVTLSLLGQSQQLIAVFLQNTNWVANSRDKFEQFLTNVTGFRITVDNIVSHKESDGTVNTNKSDTYFHGVNLVNNSIVNPQALLNIFDQLELQLNTFYTEYYVVEIKLAASSSSTNSNDVLQIALVGTACGLSVLVFIAIVTLCTCRTIYRRKLKAAQTNAYGPSNYVYASQLPGTNVHRNEGSNPLWLNATESQDNGESHNAAYQPSPEEATSQSDSAHDHLHNVTVSLDDTKLNYPQLLEDPNAYTDKILAAALNNHATAAQFPNDRDLPPAYQIHHQPIEGENQTEFKATEF